jgi:hypothetical protein
MAYELPAQGITGIKKVADHLAEFGRFGDGHLVHASEGEAVVPSAVLNENPSLKAALFTQMREKGLDPKRYVVGDKLNSINPVTGQPEFGVLDDLWGGVKSVVKAIAPVVLPVALSMTRLGPIFGAAAGTGIASLVGGASVGRSLKNAVVAGGIGGLYAGLSGAQAAGKGNRLAGFKSGVSDALTEPFMPRPTRTAAPIEERTLGVADASPIDATSGLRPITAAEASAPFGGQLQPLGVTEGNLPFAGQAFQTAAPSNQLGLQLNPLTPKIGQFAASSPSQIGQFVPNTMTKTEFARRLGPLYRGEPTGTLRNDELGRRVPFEPRQSLGLMFPEQGPIVSRPDLLQPVDPTNNIFRGTQLSAPTVGFTDVSAQGNPNVQSVSAQVNPNVQSVSAQVNPNVTVGGEGAGERSLFARTGDYLFRGGQNRDQVLDVKNAAYKKVLDKTGNEVLAEAAYNAAGPNMLQKWGPSTALGLAAAGAFGAFKQGKEPDPIDYYAQEGGTAAERLRDNPGLFSVGDPRAYVPATLEDIRVAVGGPINQDNFPRRIGPINGAGTGTSDDIRAMLSDGEYVMTAKAVRGAGNGNRKQGMNNMYNMMRQFEGQAV